MIWRNQKYAPQESPPTEKNYTKNTIEKQIEKQRTRANRVTPCIFTKTDC